MIDYADIDIVYIPLDTDVEFVESDLRIVQVADDLDIEFEASSNDNGA